MTHGKEFVADADVAPLGAQDPRAGDDAGVHNVLPGRMGTLAGFRFVAAARGANGHDLGLLSGQAFAVGIGEDNAATGQGLGGVDRADEDQSAKGH